jgi:2-hydroxymuconate-semialdehyde hydrolase
MTTSQKQSRKRPLSCLSIVVIGIGLLITAVLLIIGGWVWNTNRQIGRSETNTLQNAPGQLIEVDGVQFHVQTAGPATDPTGVPLLLLHGFGVDGAIVWSEIEPFLAEERRLILPELLGMGFSERVVEPGAHYTVAGRAEHLAQLLDSLDVSQVDVAGASYGGGVAAQFALEYPDRVRRIVFVDAQVFEAGGGFFETLGTLPLGIGRAMTWSALGAGPQSAMLMSGGCETGGFCPSADYVEARMERATLNNTTEALQAMSRTEPEARIPDELDQIDQPALVIWGTEDNIIDPARGEQLTELLPNGRLYWVDGAGHSPQLDQPDVVAAEMLTFLGDTE